MNSGAVLGSRAKRFVDETPPAPQRAQRGGADALQLVVLLQQHERLEQRRRIALEEILGYGFQQLAPDAEALVDRMIRAVVLRLDERPQVLQQDRCSTAIRLWRRGSSAA